MCFHYDNRWALAAQVLSFLATLISCFRRINAVISITGIVLFQILWCCHPRSTTRFALYSSIVVAGLTSLGSIGIGICILVFVRDKSDCVSFRNENGRIYLCPEDFWAGASVVCAVLWAMVALFTFRFARSETDTKQQEVGNNATDEEEDGGVGSSTTESSSVVELPTGIAPTTTVEALVASSKQPKVEDV